MSALFNWFRPKLGGPHDGRIFNGSFSVVTTTLTPGECQQCLPPTRTGTGAYQVLFTRGYLATNVTFSVQSATTAQTFVKTADIVTNGMITGFTMAQVTAGTGTAVDAITARVDFQVIARTSKAS